MSDQTDMPLPPKWSRPTIGVVIEDKVSQNGPSGDDTFTYVDIGGIDNSTKRIVDPKLLSVAEAPSRAKQVLAADDVLVSMTRPNLNAVAKVPAELDGAIGSTGFDVLRTKIIEPSWLYYTVQSNDFVHAMCQVVQGALYPAVRPRDIRSYSLPIPPLNEQRRIVAKIEELFSDLDAGVAALTRAKANLKRYRASVLKAAVEGHLTAASDSSFDPVNWVEIGTVLTNVEQGWSPKCERESSTIDSEWAVIKTSAVMPLQYLEHENKRLPSSLAPRPELEIKPNDLLITRAGPRNRAAVTCLVRSSRARLIVCDKVYRMRCDASKATTAFLEVVLNAPPILEELDELKTGISDSGVNLTQQRFRRLRIPLPSLQVQGQIVELVEARVSVIAAAERQIEHGLLRAARLRQSILKQAFEGKLVPQDPTDEPASVLLQRLRASQSPHEGNGKVDTPARTRVRRAKSKIIKKRADQ